VTVERRPPATWTRRERLATVLHAALILSMLPVRIIAGCLGLRDWDMAAALVAWAFVAGVALQWLYTWINRGGDG